MAVSGIEVLAPYPQWHHWLMQAAAHHADTVLMFCEKRSACTCGNSVLQAALLHADMADGALVARYRNAGVPVVILATRLSNHGLIYGAIQAGAEKVFHIKASAQGVNQGLEQTLAWLLQRQSRVVEKASTQSG